MALLARFACGCKQRVEIPAPAQVRCAEHGAVAILVQTPRGQVRYATQPLAQNDTADGEARRAVQPPSESGGPRPG